MGLGPFFFGENQMLNRRADKLELLRIAEAVALEKSIDKELIIDSMENGIAKAAKSKFGSENEIEVQINRENGDIGIFRKLLIVENPENYLSQSSLRSMMEAGNKYCDFALELMDAVRSENYQPKTLSFWNYIKLKSTVLSCR